MNSNFDLTANLTKLRLHGTLDTGPWSLKGRRMARIIENINAKSKKSRYNPETDTNWCHLPMELREKCIKEMDFMTRTRMRASSSIEKSFVDAHVYHFDKATFEWKGRPWPGRYDLKFLKTDSLSRGGEEEIGLTLGNIPPFKFCVFQELLCHSKGNNKLPVYLDKWVTECAPFRFKTLRCKGGNFGIFEYFLKNSWDGVEEIFLDIDRRMDFSIERVFCPSFINAKKVVIEGVKDIETTAFDIIRKWAENDVEIGTICHLHSGKIGKNRKDSSEKESYEVKMVNDSKKIVVEESLTRQGKEKVIMKVVRGSSPN